MALQLCPITYREACDFILQHHLHHLPPQGWKFGIAVADGDRIVGVITVGRPVARALDNGLTLEVTRCCTDGAKNAASMLYSAAWRAAKALGYRRLITFSPHAWGWTYTLPMFTSKTWVFPTRVGVDLNSAGHLARLASFPHTRGGGPRWRQDG